MRSKRNSGEKTHLADRVKILSRHTPNNRLVFGIYEELKQLKNRETILLKMGKGHRFFSIEDI